MASLFLDHNVLPRVGRILRELGHVVMTAQDCHLERATDREVLLWAGPSGLMVVSGDDDFLVLHRAGIVEHAGILLTPPIPGEPWRRARDMAYAIDALVRSGQPLVNALYIWKPAGWARDL